jgi:predicted GNAT family N-acyltransferase
MIIRKGKLSDVKILVNLDKKASKEIRWWRPMNQKEFTKLAKAKNYLYVAEEDNQIIGYLSATIKYDKLFLDNIYIKENFRKKNTAKRLITKFAGDWKKSKFKEIRLYCPEKLRKLYENLGFFLSALMMKKRLR